MKTPTGAIGATHTLPRTTTTTTNERVCLLVPAMLHTAESTTCVIPLQGNHGAISRLRVLMRQHILMDLRSSSIYCLANAPKPKSLHGYPAAVQHSFSIQLDMTSPVEVRTRSLLVLVLRGRGWVAPLEGLGVFMGKSTVVSR